MLVHPGRVHHHQVSGYLVISSNIYETITIRNAFPCMDEPSFKATFSLQVGALSNVELARHYLSMYLRYLPTIFHLSTPYLYDQVGRPEGYHVRTNTPRIETVPIGMSYFYNLFRNNISFKLIQSLGLNYFQ